jgi:AcrR family transcriptional regulator
VSVPELNDRTTAIVEAACRVVAREGTHGLRMEAVAREAGVSKALVHYYFATRRELLRAAFAFVDDRWRARVADELALAPTGADRLERFLLLYVDDEMVPGEHRAVWDEVWGTMRLDPELAPEVAAAYTRWADWIVQRRAALTDRSAASSPPRTPHSASSPSPTGWTRFASSAS